MNLTEANAVLDEHLSSLRALSYNELRSLVEDGVVKTPEAPGASGVLYQLEIQFFWDSRPGGSIRVMVSIDDGGERAFRPLTRDFIKAPDGTLVGE